MKKIIFISELLSNNSNTLCFKLLFTIIKVTKEKGLDMRIFGNSIKNIYKKDKAMKKKFRSQVQENDRKNTKKFSFSTIIKYPIEV